MKLSRQEQDRRIEIDRCMTEISELDDLIQALTKQEEQINRNITYLARQRQIVEGALKRAEGD